ncbi:ectoine/hydroxyectoine ABC transporter permease subunit EhuD [Halarcobacter anaerophilus]|uniref:ectoine/hydroxyectoine ABC transporter permease subunit EhuD n=1 Tax=Halarcobacter anaerophilus TaxID=877500 RepID=UPI0005CACE8C|nr:ectoine/hydroxyectoine ABC transporter permease subunit EhuD [Halarcobacter anaerophilus]
MDELYWDWDYTKEILPDLLDALHITINATLIGSLIALILGLVFALLRRSKYKIISKPTGFIIEFVRSTPLLVQIYFLYYVFPDYGVDMSPFMTGVIAIALHYAAYMSEVYRTGIEGIDNGQWEASIALNLSPYRTYKDVIIPQAIPPVIPALGNYIVAMFKETPQLSAITVLEMMQMAKILGSENFRYLEPFTIVGLLFLLISLVAAFCIKKVEKALPKNGIALK